jgi:tRNA G10  N-methylase Trm11
LGGDIDAKAARAAAHNLRAGGFDGRVVCWDATRLPLRDRAVDALACNLPWGGGQGRAGLPGLYRAVLGEARRVVRGGGRVVLLVAAGGLPERLVRRAGLTVERRLNVVVRGAAAVIVVARADV